MPTSNPWNRIFQLPCILEFICICVVFFLHPGLCAVQNTGLLFRYTKSACSVLNLPPSLPLLQTEIASRSENLFIYCIFIWPVLSAQLPLLTNVRCKSLTQYVRTMPMLESYLV